MRRGLALCLSLLLAAAACVEQRPTRKELLDQNEYLQAQVGTLRRELEEAQEALEETREQLETAEYELRQARSDLDQALADADVLRSMMLME